MSWTSSAGCLLPGGGTSRAGSRQEGGSPQTSEPGASRDSADVVSGEDFRLGVRPEFDPGFPLTSYIALGESFNLSEPYFTYL